MDSSGFVAEMLPPVLTELDLLALVFATRQKSEITTLNSEEHTRAADSVLLVLFLP